MAFPAFIRRNTMTRKALLQAGLGVLLVAQATVIVVSLNTSKRTTQNPTPPSFIDVGDSLHSLRTLTRGKESSLELKGDSVTLLVSLKSTCKWCTEAMPQIKSDLDGAPAAIRVMIITSEVDSVTDAYLLQHGVDHSVTALVGERGSAERTLTSRTPWAFLVDSNGVVRQSGHATDIRTMLAHVSRN